MSDKEKLIKDLKKKHENAEIGLDTSALSFISTGSLELDCCMGTGGWPCGRMSIVAGMESSGKSTLAMKAIANGQKEGKLAAYIDAEATFDPIRAVQLGIDLDNLILIRSYTLEEAGEIAVDLARSGIVDIIVFDSVAGVSIQTIDEGEIGSSHIGKKAKMLGHLATKLTGPVWSNKVCFIFINQLRDSLDMYKPLPVMPGGHALPFASSITIYLNSRPVRKDDGELEAIGDGSIFVKATVHKNKLAPAKKTAEFIMRPNGEINLISEIKNVLLNNLEDFGIVKGGAWYEVPDFISGIPEKVHGQAGMIELLNNNLHNIERIKEKILSIIHHVPSQS